MEKEPIISECVSAGFRVYYFDIYMDSKGSHYLAISEIPTDKSPGNKKRQRIFIHADRLRKFAKILKKLNRKLAKLPNVTSR